MLIQENSLPSTKKKGFLATLQDANRVQVNSKIGTLLKEIYW